MSAPTGGLTPTVHAPSGGTVQQHGNGLAASAVNRGTRDKSKSYIYIYEHTHICVSHRSGLNIFSVLWVMGSYAALILIFVVATVHIGRETPLIICERVAGGWSLSQLTLGTAWTSGQSSCFNYI